MPVQSVVKKAQDPRCQCEFEKRSRSTTMLSCREERAQTGLPWSPGSWRSSAGATSVPGTNTTVPSKKSNEEPLVYLRLNVAAIRATIPYQCGQSGNEHVEHFLDTLNDESLARQRIPLCMTSESQIRETFKRLDRQLAAASCSGVVDFQSCNLSRRPSRQY